MPSYPGLTPRTPNYPGLTPRTPNYPGLPPQSRAVVLDGEVHVFTREGEAHLQLALPGTMGIFGVQGGVGVRGDFRGTKG